MAKPLTNEKIVADIIKVSAAGEDPQTQTAVGDMCKIFAEFIAEYAGRTNGYMYIIAFITAFTELKKISNNVSGPDKVFLDGLISSIIGSYGSTIQ